MTPHKQIRIRTLLTFKTKTSNVAVFKHVDRVGKFSFMLRRDGYRPIIVLKDVTGKEVQKIYDDIDKECPVCGNDLPIPKGKNKTWKCRCEWEFKDA